MCFQNCLKEQLPTWIWTNIAAAVVGLAAGGVLGLLIDLFGWALFFWIGQLIWCGNRCRRIEG